MAEVSNESLALLMVAVIVVVIGAIVSLSWMGMPEITGRASGEAKLNVSVQTGIVLDNNTVDFGRGYITSPSTVCSLCSLDGANSPPSCWTNQSDYLSGTGVTPNITVRSEANTGINVTIASSVGNASTLLGVSDSSIGYKFKSVCGDCTGGTQDTFAEFDEGTSHLIGYWDGSSMNSDIYIPFNITITENVTGYKNDTLTISSVLRS